MQISQPIAQRSGIEGIIAREEQDVNSARPRKHLRHVDGLRALAALYVMIGHAALEVWPVYTTHHRPIGLVEQVLFGLFSYGHFAVSVFIVVSGFCLMLPVVKNGGMLDGGARLFFRKRARRILPPYYFAIVLSLLLIATLVGHKTGTHWDCALPVTASGIAAHVFLVQDIWGSPQINHVFWSIALEWQIYFLFPLLLLIWRRCGALFTVCISVLVSTFARSIPVLFAQGRPKSDVSAKLVHEPMSRERLRERGQENRARSHDFQNDSSLCFPGKR